MLSDMLRKCLQTPVTTLFRPRFAWAHFRHIPQKHLRNRLVCLLLLQYIQYFHLLVIQTNSLSCPSLCQLPRQLLANNVYQHATFGLNASSSSSPNISHCSRSIARPRPASLVSYLCRLFHAIIFGPYYFRLMANCGIQSLSIFSRCSVYVSMVAVLYVVPVADQHLLVINLLPSKWYSLLFSESFKGLVGYLVGSIAAKCCWKYLFKELLMYFFQTLSSALNCSSFQNIYWYFHPFIVNYLSFNSFCDIRFQWNRCVANLASRLSFWIYQPEFHSGSCTEFFL